jgi:hypothetical protein
MNFFINLFYIYLGKFGKKGVEASIYALTIVLMFNFITAITFLFYIIQIDVINFITSSVVAIAFGLWINKVLEKNYLQGERFRDLLLPKIFYFITPIYYLASVLMFIISLRYS